MRTDRYMIVRRPRRVRRTASARAGRGRPGDRGNEEVQLPWEVELLGQQTPLAPISSGMIFYS